jgi:hypothetical protein
MQIPFEGLLRDLAINSSIFSRVPPHLDHDLWSEEKPNLSFGQYNVPEILQVPVGAQRLLPY